MQQWISVAAAGLFVCAALCPGASPEEFGMAEFNAAVARLKYKPKIKAELDLNPPETFHIEPYTAGGAHITGGDLRGLMYALIEASQQIRDTGRLKRAQGAPALDPRGVRVAADPESAWFGSQEFWEDYFAGMARNRLDRLHLVFENFPSRRLVPAIRMISQTASRYGVDLALGSPHMAGADFDSTFPSLLEQCPNLRAIVVDPSDAGLASNREVLLDGLRNAGRRVVLELPEGGSSASLETAAARAGVPVRRFRRYDCAAGDADCADRGESSKSDFYWRIAAGQASAGVENIRALLTGLSSGFEVDDPPDASGSPVIASVAAWGRLGYDPKPPAPPKPAVKTVPRTRSRTRPASKTSRAK